MSVLGGTPVGYGARVVTSVTGRPAVSVIPPVASLAGRWAWCHRLIAEVIDSGLAQHSDVWALPDEGPHSHRPQVVVMVTHGTSVTETRARLEELIDRVSEAQVWSRVHP